MFSLGDYDTTETVDIPFNTFDSNDPSASVTVTDLLAGDVRIYKDGSITQRTSANGVTVTLNFDGNTGSHMIHVDLSDDTDSGFYAAGSRYAVSVVGVTVDAATLNPWVGTYSIGIVLRPTTAGRTLDILSTGEVAADLTMMGGSPESAMDLKDFADAGYDPATNKVQGVVLVDTVTTVTNQLTSVVVAAAVWDRVLTGGTHNIVNSAGRRLRTLQESGGVYGGQIYIDTVNGTAGTTNYENGTSDNAVLTLADAKTISGSIGIPDFHVINGSSITLAESTANESYFGDNWTLALGGQATAGAFFTGAIVSGIQTGSGVGFLACEIGTVTLANGAHANQCGIEGTVTLPVGSINLNSCHHDGATAPILDFGAAVGNTTIHMHNYSGAVELQNFGDNGTDILHLDGNGKLTINANSSGGTVHLRGNWEIEDNAGNATINYDDQSQGYDGGRIWVDTVGGTAGTNDHINGTSDTPCLTIADAKTLSNSTGLSDFHIINGSAIVLGESTDNESYFGDNWTLDLSDESVDGAHFVGAEVSGAGPSAVSVHYEGCNFTTASIALGHFDFCAFAGTLTQTTAGDYEYHNCYSKGTTPPVFTKTAGQAINVEFHNYSGDITVSGLESGDVIELGGNFRTVVLNGADATVHIHGHYETLTNNLTGSPAVSVTGGIKFQDVADTLVDTADIQPKIGTPSADLSADIAAIPTTAMRGTDSAATAVNLATAQADLDILTGPDGAILDSTQGNYAPAIPSEVNAEVLDVLNVDTFAEPGQETPTATTTLVTKISYLYKFLRNRVLITDETISVLNDDAVTVDHKSAHSDDGTTYDRGEFTTGP